MVSEPVPVSGSGGETHRERGVTLRMTVHMYAYKTVMPEAMPAMTGVDQSTATKVPLRGRLLIKSSI